MKTRICICIILAMAIHGFCLADVTKLPAGDQKGLRDVSRFREIRSATNWPPMVFELC
jgi:hypothetical protein